MKTNSIIEVIKGSSVVVPYVLLKNYKKLNINEKELLFLSFLMSQGEKIINDECRKK